MRHVSLQKPPTSLLLFAAGSLFLVNCGLMTGADSSKKVAVALSISPRSTGLSERGLNAPNSSVFSLSPDYCYWIHVTGDTPELARLPPQSQSCAAPYPGLGLVAGFYEKGDEARVQVPPGLQRRFDLVGVPKSSVPGASCRQALFVEIGAPRADGGHDVRALVGGVEMSKADHRLIATGRADIVMGDNFVALVATADNADGVKYGCDGQTSSPGDGTVPVPGPNPSPTATSFPVAALPPSLSVSATYPTNPKWNDYILRTSGSAHWLQSDTACSPSGINRPNECVHAGDKRKVILTGMSSCAGYTLMDALDAFTWVCDSSSGVATYYSTGLKPDRRLSDLIDPNGAGAGVPDWKPNHVILSNGQATLPSTPAKWWTNPLANLPAGTFANLNATSTIYIVPSTISSQGVYITADKVGVVIFPGAALDWSNGGLTCNLSTGTAVSADTRCFIFAQGRNYLWIEGTLLLGGTFNVGAEYGIHFHTVKMSMIRRMKISATDKNNSPTAIRLFSSRQNRLQQNYIANLNNSVNLDSSSYNDLFDLSIFSSTDGLRFGSTSQYNVIVGLTSAHIGQPIAGFGINIGTSAASANTFSHVTVAGAISSGVSSGGSDQVFNQMVLMNNGYSGGGYQSGLSADTHNSSGIKVSDLIVAHHLSTGGIGLRLLSGANHNVFTGEVGVGNNTTNCSITATTNVGITPVCAPADSSNFTLRTGLDLANSFGGPVTTEDNSNASDTTGMRAVGSISDWTFFESPYRGWGKDSANPFPDDGHKGFCSSGNCRIFDYRLKSTDTVLRNANGAFVPGVPCPTSVRGIESQTDPLGSYFLRAAVEIVDDGRGDDDGLCESNESCVFSPNRGAYQGEGALQSQSCIYDAAGGWVSNVLLFGRTINGI